MFNQGSEAEENIKGLSKKAIVSDINLVEDETTTIKIAKAYGISRTQDGKPMMFFQAIPAFLHVHPNIISEGELENMMRKASF
jgi:shikimate 5-dehydrogenase